MTQDQSQTKPKNTRKNVIITLADGTPVSGPITHVAYSASESAPEDVLDFDGIDKLPSPLDVSGPVTAPFPASAKSISVRVEGESGFRPACFTYEGDKGSTRKYRVEVNLDCSPETADSITGVTVKFSDGTEVDFCDGLILVTKLRPRAPKANASATTAAAAE